MPDTKAISRNTARISRSTAEHSCGPSSGFTIIEVTIALSILVGALLLTVGHMSNVMSVQTQTSEQAGIGRVLKSVADRITATDPTKLGTDDAPWSIARYQDGRGAAPMRVADLVSMELAPREVGPSDLRVYFEYWRMIDFTNPTTGVISPGLMNTSTTDPTEFAPLAYVDPQHPLNGIKAQFQLEGWDEAVTTAGNSPFTNSAVLDSTHPVMVRLLATWDNDPDTGTPRQYRELFTARSPP